MKLRDITRSNRNENEEGGNTAMLLKAENIALNHERLDNEIIPLGATRIEVVLGEVPLDQLKLDPTNPRLQFKLAAQGVTNPTEEQLREMLWETSDVKALKRSIEANGGLIEAIIVSGKDGTVFEGNCRLTSLSKLREETKGADSRWTHARARILPPEVTRDTVDVLLGELHIAGKNEWSPFEQAAHLYKMNTVKGYTEEVLAEMYRMSKSYISAKIRAYRLMDQTLVPTARQRKHEVKDLSGLWSWFEEFYKSAKPSLPGKEDPDRVYDGRDLELKFCEWVLDGKFPQAAEVRMLRDVLDDGKAMKFLEDQGGNIHKAFSYVAGRKPSLMSKFWKQLEATTAMLQAMPLEEIEALRDGDVAKLNDFEALVKAIDRVKRELKK